jgi:hypothetical protein
MSAQHWQIPFLSHVSSRVRAGFAAEVGAITLLFILIPYKFAKQHKNHLCILFEQSAIHHGF